MKKVVIICRSCEYRNSNYRGLSGFTELQTEYESLTDAWQHLLRTNEDRDDCIHEMEMVIR